jgi:hypothetical protein
MPTRSDGNPVPIEARVRVLEVGQRMGMEQAAEVVAALREMNAALDRIADDVAALRDSQPAGGMAHIEQAADVILDNAERMDRFWKRGHKTMIELTWDTLTQAIGSRLLTMVITAAFVVVVAWAVARGQKL